MTGRRTVRTPVPGDAVEMLRPSGGGGLRDAIESSRMDRDGAGRLRTHYHDRHEVILVEEGAAQYDVEGRKYAVSAGCLVVVSRLERHEMRVVERPYVRRFLLVDPAFYQEAVGDPALASLFRSRPAGYRHVVRLEGEDFGIVRDWLARLHEELHEDLHEESGKEGGSRGDGPGEAQAHRRGAAAALLRLFAIALFRRRPELFPVRASHPGSVRVAEAQSLIERRYLDRSLDLASIASGVFCSPDHLSHAFKRLTGYPVMRYVSLQRIAHAKDLLARTDLSVSEVCAASGFGDGSHFIRAFREETGETPLRFRKKVRG